MVEQLIVASGNDPDSDSKDYLCYLGSCFLRNFLLGIPNAFILQ